MTDRREQAARIETEAAIRWANNMLHEVIGNHGGEIPVDARASLRDAVNALSRCRIELAAAKVVSGVPSAGQLDAALKQAAKELGQ